MSATENAIPPASPSCLAERDCDDVAQLHARHSLADRWSLGLAEPRPAWPPRLPALPADGYYATLSTRLAVAERAPSAVWGSIQRTARRVLDLVRPHSFDVDAFVCGSFASGTLLPSSKVEVDVVVRFAEPRPTWPQAEAEAAKEVCNWLRYGFMVHRVSRGAVSVQVDEELELRLLPAWRADDGSALIASSPDGKARRIRFDPAGHRDLLIARQQSLGPESPFTALIRIVKLLNGGWTKRMGRAPLSSYYIDALALHLCRAPFTLAEGVADFLRQAAEAVHTSLPDPVRVGSGLRPLDQAVASAMLAQAAEQAEAALMAKSTRDAEDALDALFADTVEATRPHSYAAVCSQPT